MENTTEERKLLFFELTGRSAFQHGEARLSGARDGKWRRKFRGIYRGDRDAANGLAAGGAGGEVGRTGGLAMLEAVAAQAAGRRKRGVGAERHRGHSTTHGGEAASRIWPSGCARG